MVIFGNMYYKRYMNFTQILKQIIQEYWSYQGGAEVWIEPKKDIYVDSNLTQEEIENLPDVKLFFDKLDIKPGKGAIQNYFYNNKENLKTKQNPFKRGTWSYHVWNVYWLEYISESDDEECRKIITLRKRSASAANKIHPNIYVSFGDDDC